MNSDINDPINKDLKNFASNIGYIVIKQTKSRRLKNLRYAIKYKKEKFQ